MKSKEIRAVRCDDALKVLIKEGEAVFFTLTTADKVDYHTIRARWRALRHALLRALRRKYPKRAIQYVMNYEAHNGYLQKIVKDRRTVDRVIRSDGNPHGWHIHGVINCFVDLREFRSMLDKCGFGRVDVRRVNSRGVSDYLTKHALKAYRGLSAKERQKYAGARMRLVNASRGLPSLNDYAYRSALLDSVKPLMSEARRIEEETKLRLRDYRVAYQRAQVCALLGLPHVWQLGRFIEALSSGGLGYAQATAARLAWSGAFENLPVADEPQPKRKTAKRETRRDYLVKSHKRKSGARQ